MSKLIIGTANFGMDYGISNPSGKLSDKKITRIFEAGQNCGIDTMDTAQAYGDAEKRVGNILNENNFNFNIITKLKPGISGSIIDLFETSLTKLKTKQLYGLLYHSFADYKVKPDTWYDLQKLKNIGKVLKIGFSLYYPYELELLIRNNIDFNIIQIPYSIFDRRFEYLFEILKMREVEIHTRSVFLQGLVFSNPNELNPKLSKLKEKIEILQNLSSLHSMSIASICLNFVYMNSNINNIVIGVNDANSLIENTNSVKDYNRIAQFTMELERLQETDEQLIIPSNW